MQQAGLPGTPPHARVTVFASERARASLPRRIYLYRTLGFGLAALAVAMVLYEQRAGLPAWSLCVFVGLVWPHIAYQWSRRSADPFLAEQRNLLIDSAIATFMVVLVQFNLLPSVLLLALSAADKVNTDIPGLLRRSLLPSLAGLLAGGLLIGFTFEPHTSTAVILACLPMMLIHTWMVSLGRLQLVRKILQKNQELDLLSRTDLVTGLELRGHWERRAAAALHDVHTGARPAALVLIDMDGFKLVNDHHGHVAGDALLRKAGAVLRGMLRPGDIAGRYGGDEFAVVCPDTGLDEAMAMAEAYRANMESVVLIEAPGHAHSVSIGIARARANHARIEDWINAADKALYEAKRRGRNCLVLAPKPSAQGASTT